MLAVFWRDVVLAVLPTAEVTEGDEWYDAPP